MVDHANNTESVFWAAVEIETPETRAAFLDEACGKDRELRERIEEMLAAHPKLEKFMEQRPDVTIDQPIAERVGP